MPSFHQILKTSKRSKKLHTNNVKALKKCPQKKAICVHFRIVKPKKPNSAQRKIVKVRLSYRKLIIAYIPGQGHTLQEFSSVMIHGGRAKDVPGVRYSLMRGKLDFSWKESFDRMKKRSKYGISLAIYKKLKIEHLENKKKDE
jgi:small subunit ribosomal protein S12